MKGTVRAYAIVAITVPDVEAESEELLVKAALEDLRERLDAALDHDFDGEPMTSSSFTGQFAYYNVLRDDQEEGDELDFIDKDTFAWMNHAAAREAKVIEVHP